MQGEGSLDLSSLKAFQNKSHVESVFFFAGTFRSFVSQLY